MTRPTCPTHPPHPTDAPQPARARRAVVVTGLALGLVTVAAGCQQCQPPPPPSRGNVDRVADVVVVAADDGHSYAVLANPELEHLRVLDVTQGAFVTGPNRFFPLSVPVGSETRSLSLAVRVEDDAAGPNAAGIDAARIDPTRLYALDSSDDVIAVIAVVDEKRGVAPFSVLATVPTGRAPVDLAALRTGDVTEVAVALPPASPADAGTLAIHRITAAGDDDGSVVVALGPGSSPSAVVADPFGRAFVVADAALAVLHVVARDDDGAWALAAELPAGGPTHELGAGVVDVGDGLAPVVVALRSDAPALVAARLFRPGFREDRYAVLGGAALPSLGLVVAVPDARPSTAVVTVCCRGLSDDRIAAHEATSSFAAVTQANGQLLYVQLAADRVDDLVLAPGRRVVRLVDDDGQGPSPPDDVDVNADAALWLPTAGGDALRPTLSFVSIDNFGSPPFVPLVDDGRTLSLTWEGDVPGLVDVAGAFAAGPHTFTAAFDVAARDARTGDVARLATAAPRPGCDASHRARVLAVDGGVLTLAAEGDGSGAIPALTSDVITGCLQGGDDVTLTVEAQGAFVVEDASGLVGRVQFAADDGNVDNVDDEEEEAEALELPGVRVTLAPAAGGVPVPGSVVFLPLDAHTTTLGLDLPAPTNTGGFGAAALVPTGVAMATATIPDAASDVDGAVLDARRMVMTTASLDATSGLPLVFTCDEGETTSARVETFR